MTGCGWAQPAPRSAPGWVAAGLKRLGMGARGSLPLTQKSVQTC